MEAKDIKKEILEDEFVKQTANELKVLFGKTDKRSMMKKAQLMDELVKHFMEKLPNAVDFVELLNSDKPKIGLEKLLADEDIRTQIVAVGNFYNMMSARVKAEKGMDMGSFNDYLKLVLSISYVLEYMRKYRPDLYMALTDVELNRKKCILSKFNEALVEVVQMLQSLPYKKYVVKKK